jgi:hypothetical protein
MNSVRKCVDILLRLSKEQNGPDGTFDLAERQLDEYLKPFEANPKARFHALNYLDTGIHEAIEQHPESAKFLLVIVDRIEMLRRSAERPVDAA